MIDSLERLIRMGIHEPYLHRVQNKKQQVLKHRGVFEMIEIYLNAFEFMRIQAYQYFQQEEAMLQEFQVPADNGDVTKEFKKKVTEVKEDLESTSETEEGRIIC